MSSDDELLNERLASQEPSDRLSAVTRKGVDSNDCQAVATPSPTHTTFDYTEWGIAPNGIFRPSGARCNILPAGVYRAGLDVGGVYFENRNVITDELIELDDTASLRVLAGIRTFWKSKEEYTKRSIIYKRGILLWGPAGSGKTATLMMMTRELVALGGLVILCENPELTNKALQALRRIEPDRPIIILMEDIEELISSHGEHDILALLDGENQINNVVNIATTNYPEVLGARIVNRPSRFDERIFVGMPSDAARRRYLSHATRNEVFSERI
jgi:SpoVK/Ycf46/Vps4 family AAA+-type ATPase